MALWSCAYQGLEVEAQRAWRCGPTTPAVRHLIQANGVRVLTLPVLLASVGWSPAAPGRRGILATVMAALVTFAC